MFERSLQLSLHTSKRFNAFQVLKWFLLLLEVTSVIFARATNADVWQAFVARANTPIANMATMTPKRGFSVATPLLRAGCVCFQVL